MFEFTSWCFLCANSNEVETIIESLSSEIKDKISEFSIVNYNIPNCPSRICKICLKFLENLLYLPKRYENVEKFYIEVLKNKNKTLDLTELRKRYDLVDAEEVKKSPKKVNRQSPVKALPSPTKSQEENEVPDIHVHSPPPKKKSLPQQKKLPVKDTPPQSPLKQKPKLLNPTILPKIESKSRLDLIICDLCGHTTSTNHALEKHMEIHLKNEAFYECKICNKKFARKGMLASHEMTHKLSTDRKTFQCNECDKHLSSVTALNTHMKWYHSEREFDCHICNKQFATKGSLKEHLKIHSDQKQHVCPICKKEYKTASTLSNHIDTHSTTTYECFQCGMKLNSKRTLKQHEKVHSDIKTHICKICSAQFKRTKAYKEHLITHSNIRPYSCDFCEKTFKNGPNCRKHMRDVHSDELDEAEKKGVDKKIVKLPTIDELLASIGSGAVE